MSFELGWPRFTFFEKTQLSDLQRRTINEESRTGERSPSPDAGTRFAGVKDVSIECWQPVGDAVFLGEAPGAVFKLTHDLEEFFWKAYQKSLVAMTSVDQILITVGEDEEGVNSLLKVWDLQKMEKDKPFTRMILRLTPLIGAGSTTPATAVAVHSSKTAIAVGFADGSVLLYQSDDAPSASKWLRVNPSQPSNGPVTGVALALLPRGRLVVFVITSKIVTAYTVENRSVVSTLRLDAVGVPRSCWWFTESTGELVVATRDMVYIYNAELCVSQDVTGRCYALGRGHEKLQVLTLPDGHIALLTKQPANIQTADDSRWMSVLSVYDVQGQFSAFSVSMPNTTTRLFVLDGTLMLLTPALHRDGQVLREGSISSLTQKPLGAKLEILCGKNLYNVATGLAKRSGTEGEDFLRNIYTKYGDHLYSKGDFETAMQQYRETIGFLEPSYVIKKFLGGSKVQYLCTYLEALRDKGDQNKHHMSMLMNCYTQLAAHESTARLADEKILAFIQNPSDKCDADAIFNILREAGQTKAATAWAMKLKLHASVLALLIEDANHYERALQYIEKQPQAEACKYMEQYGNMLLEEIPDKTADAITRLLEKSADGAANDHNSTVLAGTDMCHLVRIFVNDPPRMAKFVEKALKKVRDSPKESSAFLNTFLELRLRDYAKGNLEDSAVLKELGEYVTKANEERALELARLFDSTPLVTHILTSTQRVKELQQYYLKKNLLHEVIELCIQQNSSEMWLNTLVHVSKLNTEVDEAVVKKLLRGIESGGTMHPLVVLDVLSRSNSLKISGVKDYVLKWLRAQEEQIHSDEEAIKSCEKRIEENVKQVEDLNYSVQVLQVQTCRACNTALTLPAVHFMCRHSFHVHCFESYSGNRPDACPDCAQHAAVSSQVSEDEDLALDSRTAYQTFQNELNSSVNGMELVSKYLSRGLFDPPRKSMPSKLSSPARSTSSNPFLSSSNNPFDED